MPHAVDTHVGKRIRTQRNFLRWTQQELAEAVGIKFQQIQKYETGSNRVSASRLWDIAHALGVPITFFFEGLKNDEESQDKQILEIPSDLLETPGAIKLLSLYMLLSEKIRGQILRLMKSIVEER